MKAPKALKFLFLTTVLYSCYEYPLYKTHSTGKIRNNEYYTLDSVSLVLFEIQAVQSKSAYDKVIDTLEIQTDDLFTTNLISKISLSFNITNTAFAKEITRFPYKRFVPRFLNTLDYEGNVIVLFPTYLYTVSDEREGGGGVGFAYDNGYQRHNVTHSLHVAVFQDSRLVYLDNAIRFEQIRTKKGIKIDHVFPQEVVDSLVHIALSDYVERLE
ncbi:MAG: hypothetical protein WBG42_16430 [Cryomorphaceae bacterium]